jgi:hypothetical protein
VRTSEAEAAAVEAVAAESPPKAPSAVSADANREFAVIGGLANAGNEGPEVVKSDAKLSLVSGYSSSSNDSD